MANGSKSAFHVGSIPESAMSEEGMYFLTGGL